MDAGVLLEDLTWPEAERLLTPEKVVVVPLGAAAKEHGPHLKLKNDWLIAEYLKRQVLHQLPVVVTPTLNYGFYPAFIEYPGSTTLRQEIARGMVVDICRSLARFGPTRFYVLNTGISTVRALRPAAEDLLPLTLRWTDLHAALQDVPHEQPWGSHADEIETSMMLHIAPETVDMAQAVRDCEPDRPGGLTRQPDGPGTYSKSGVWGDATLATREKGERICQLLTERVLSDLRELLPRP